MNSRRPHRWLVNSVSGNGLVSYAVIRQDWTNLKHRELTYDEINYICIVVCQRSNSREKLDEIDSFSNTAPRPVLLVQYLNVCCDSWMMRCSTTPRSFLPSSSTHWKWTKWPKFCRPHFQMHSFRTRFLVLKKNHLSLFMGSHWRSITPFPTPVVGKQPWRLWVNISYESLWNW